MKFAIIAPIAELHALPSTSDMHLVLPHLLDDPLYESYYRQRSMDGDWIILDNSAYERTAVNSVELLNDAIRVHADEIVIPDKLNDCEATLELAGQTFDYLATAQHVRLLKPQLMLVPQGRTIEEWRTCLFGLVLRWNRFVRGNPELQSRETPSIGLAVPATQRVGLRTEVLLESWLLDLNQRDGYDIHLLGARSLYQLNRLARLFPWVRSTDTAKPVYLAMQGIRLDPLTEPEPKYAGRPTDFFTQTLTAKQREAALHNIQITAQLADGLFKRVVGS